VLVHILDHKINRNYDALGWDIIEKVNGEAVLNVADCFSKVVNAEEEFVIISMLQHGTIVLDQEGACHAAKDLQEEHKMFELVSEDLKSVQGAEKYLVWTRTREQLIDTKSNKNVKRNKAAKELITNDA